MNKVYVVFSIPDYIGIDIEKIFIDELKAIKYVHEKNKDLKSYEKLDYYEVEVDE